MVRATTAGDGELRFDSDKDRPTVGRMPPEKTYSRRRKPKPEKRAVLQGVKTITSRRMRNVHKKSAFLRKYE